MASKNQILIVDDDKMLLASLKSLLSKYYEIETFESAVEALDKINAGYYPQVIVCDKKMPKMDGAEFLKKSIVKCPLSSRILITATYENSEIITGLNISQAAMFLKKPIDNLELIQTIKVGLELFKTKEQNKNLISELESSKESKPQEKFSITTTTADIIILVNEFINKFEQLYFTDHSEYVFEISKYIAKKVKKPVSVISTVSATALLHNYTTLDMPEEIAMEFPFELQEEERELYIFHFKKQIRKLSKVKLLEQYAKPLLHLWEHTDGSGYPDGLYSGEISKEAQIVALANIYHTMVYSLTPEEIDILKKGGKVIREPDVTKELHEEAVKFLYRRSNWYYSDIMKSIRDAIRLREIPYLIPQEKNLTLKLFDFEDDKYQEKDLKKQKTQFDGDRIEIGKLSGDLLEKEIDFEQLQPGMILAQNIVTGKGVLIAKYETRLKSGSVNKIKEMLETEQLEGKVSVIITAESYYKDKEVKSNFG